MESSIASNTRIKFEFSMLLMQPQSLTESCENEKSQSRSGIAPSVKKWGSGRDPRVHNLRLRDSEYYTRLLFLTTLVESLFSSCQGKTFL